MTPVPSDPAAPDVAAPLDVVLHEEQARVGVTRVPFRTVRIHRRVITETRLVEVQVRTEVLDIDWHDADPSDPPGTAPNPERLEFILHGEEPEIRLVSLAKERVVLTRVNVAGTTDVQAELRSERISVDTPQTLQR